jgi:CO/xanthine dehydrogenase Mo-binding subunit
VSDNKSIGRSVKRLEDRPLLMGNVRFVADLAFPDMLEAAFVRNRAATAIRTCPP